MSDSGFTRMCVLALLFVACGGSSTPDRNAPCTAAGRCPKDSPPTSDQIQTCESSLDDSTCGAKYQVLLQCIAGAEQCAADGTENVQGTLAAAATACATARKDWNLCVRGTSGDAGITDWGRSASWLSGFLGPIST